MTDKQIIIDGCDVSGCKNALQGKHTIICAGSEYRALCDANKDCLYKKYKRKEQECEELKLDLIEAKAHGDYLNNLALSKTLGTVSDELDQLKAENEELKDKVEKLTILGMDLNQSNELLRKTFFATDKSRDNWREKAEKYFRTLIEIKEICNNNDELQGDFNLVDCDKYKLGKHNLANKILQKISECEVENAR